MKTKQQNTNPTNKKIAEIRAKGIKVMICHFRRVFSEQIPTREPIVMPQWAVQHNKNYKILNRGGHTYMKITKDNVDQEFVSICSPEDNFSRKIGINKCFQRLGL